MKHKVYKNQLLIFLKHIGVIVGVFSLIIILMNSVWIVPRWLFQYFDSSEKFVIIPQDIYSIEASILVGIVFAICYILQLHHDKLKELKNNKPN